MADHTLAMLLDAGLCITINSDDPAYFGGYVNDNYRAAFASLPTLDARAAVTLLCNSFEASFLPADVRRRWIAQVGDAFRST